MVFGEVVPEMLSQNMGSFLTGKGISLNGLKAVNGGEGTESVPDDPIIWFRGSTSSIGKDAGGPVPNRRVAPFHLKHLTTSPLASILPLCFIFQRLYRLQAIAETIKRMRLTRTLLSYTSTSVDTPATYRPKTMR